MSVQLAYAAPCIPSSPLTLSPMIDPIIFPDQNSFGDSFALCRGVVFSAVAKMEGSTAY